MIYKIYSNIISIPIENIDITPRKEEKKEENILSPQSPTSKRESKKKLMRKGTLRKSTEEKSTHEEKEKGTNFENQEEKEQKEKLLLLSLEKKRKKKKKVKYLFQKTKMMNKSIGILR